MIKYTEPEDKNAYIRYKNNWDVVNNPQKYKLVKKKSGWTIALIVILSIIIGILALIGLFFIFIIFLALLQQ